MPTQVPDGFELIKDGTARLVIDGEVHRLRRPKVGEFRKLRELLHQRDDEEIRLLANHAGETPKPEQDADKVDAALAAKAHARQWTEIAEGLNTAWVTEVLSMLLDKEPPPVDEWPEGMETVQFIKDLVEHWRAVPLARGVG